MVHIAKPVYQLDGSTYAGSNCVAASDAMAIDRSTQGAKTTTGAHIRALTGDTSGGLLLDQVRIVNKTEYNLTCAQANKMSWPDFIDSTKDAGGIALIRYSVLVGTRFDASRGHFFGNHAVWVNHRNADGSWHVMDPLADGRYAGCPHGYQDWPDSFLRKAAGAFVVTIAPIGLGYVQVLFSTPDAAVVQPPPVVVPNAPAPAERNVMIQPAVATVTSTHVKTLAKGQPLFRYPGGPKVTAMSATASVAFIGTAGKGWHSVRVSTGAPYVDGKTRPTIVYVPAAAGPIKAL